METPLSQRLFSGIMLWALVLFGILFSYNISVRANRHFVYLADSFLHGRLDFQPAHAPYLTLEQDGKIIWQDTAFWQGKYYWPLGPLPAVLLMLPVAIFGTNFLQGYVSFFLVALNFWLIYRLSQLQGHTHKNSLYLATAFIFGSTYIGVAFFPVSWFYAQVVGTTLTLLAMFEYCRSPAPNWWLIGTYLGLAAATRLTLAIGAVFFIYLLLTGNGANKLRQLIKMAVPITAALLILLAYNFARFQNPLESGYRLQHVPQWHAQARSVGFFSLKHVPTNLYFLLLHGPKRILIDENSSLLKFPYIQADLWGMSIFFNTPLLIYLLLYKKRNNILRAALLTTGLMLVPILTYYGIGAAQFGYRYAIDFLPFIFLALISLLAPDLPRAARWLIIISTIFNTYLACVAWFFVF